MLLSRRRLLHVARLRWERECPAQSTIVLPHPLNALVRPHSPRPHPWMQKLPDEIYHSGEWERVAEVRRKAKNALPFYTIIRSEVGQLANGQRDANRIEHGDEINDLLRNGSANGRQISESGRDHPENA